MGNSSTNQGRGAPPPQQQAGMGGKRGQADQSRMSKTQQQGAGRDSIADTNRKGGKH
jgi:hypothetical protein